MILPNRFSFDGVKYPNALKIICCSDSVGTELPILPTICSLATELLYNSAYSACSLGTKLPTLPIELELSCLI